MADIRRGMWQPEAKAAMQGWRDALHEMTPAVPFDQDKRKAAEVVLKDERIANALFEQRKAAHIQEGLDPVTAGKAATQDMTELARRFGGE